MKKVLLILFVSFCVGSVAYLYKQERQHLKILNSCLERQNLSLKNVLIDGENYSCQETLSYQPEWIEKEWVKTLCEKSVGFTVVKIFPSSESIPRSTVRFAGQQPWYQKILLSNKKSIYLLNIEKNDKIVKTKYFYYNCRDFEQEYKK